MDGPGNFFFTECIEPCILVELPLAAPPTITFPTATTEGSTDTTDGARSVTIANNGNVPLVFPALAAGDNPSFSSSAFAWDSSSTCGQTSSGSTTPFSLAPGASCTLAVKFTPTTVGANVGSIVLTGNFGNAGPPNYATESIPLAGTGLAGATPIPPSLTTPTPGSALTGSSVTFQWSLGNQGVTQTSLQVGTTGIGSSDIFNGSLGSATSAQVTGIPETGGTLYVRLNYQLGASLDSIDYQYTEAPAPPTNVINFANGFAGASLDLNANAKISSGALSLITGCCQVASAYYPTPVAISSFTTTFTFLFTSADADGLTFVVQNQGPTALGCGGGGLGYGQWTCGSVKITPSAAVKFDLYNNQGEGSDSTGFYTDGAPPTVPAVDMSNSPINLHSGHPMQVELTYDGQNLTETITDTVTQGQFTHTYSNINLPQILGASTAYAGFTASSGALGSIQSVLSWTYYAEGQPTLPALTSPAPGSTLAGSSQLFQWSLGNQGVTQTSLQVGTAGAGSSDIYNGTATTAASVTVSNIPINGATLYVRLNYLLNSAWNSIDYTLTEASPVLPSLTTPAPGSTLTGSSATFSWSPGIGSTSFMLQVGTTGAGSSDIYNGTSTTATSVTVSNIPVAGAQLYVRLSYSLNSTWSSIDYTLTEFKFVPPSPTAPSPGSTLTGSSANFSWNPGNAATQFKLQVGTAGAGSSDVYNGTATSANSVTVSNIPVNSAQLYVRLSYSLNSVWSSIDYTLTGASPVLPSLTTPSPGSTLTGSSANFSWNPGNVAKLLELQVGTTPGMHDVYGGGPTKATSVQVNNIPTNGATLYATLYYYVPGGAWKYLDYTITESGTPTLPSMMTPSPGSTLTGSSVTFQWDPGAGATRFELRVGTGPGRGDIYRGGPTSATSVPVSNIPTHGRKIFAELYYALSGKWHYILYTFTEAR
jgi:hypothetical protein